MIVSGREEARAGLQAHCELGENLAQRLGLSATVRLGLGAAFEQWNGAGMPNGLRGEQIPLSARIVFLARDAEVIHRSFDLEAAAAAIRPGVGKPWSARRSASPNSLDQASFTCC